LANARESLERIGTLVSWDSGAACDQVLSEESKRFDILRAERAAQAPSLMESPAVRGALDNEIGLVEQTVSTMTVNALRSVYASFGITRRAPSAATEPAKGGRRS
jgi:hypothetical protein